MKRAFWILLLTMVQPLMAQEMAPGLVGEYWEMQPEDLVPGAVLIQDFPIITDQKPTLSRADKTINIESTQDSLPGTGLSDNFYIRWTGKIRIAKETTYTFYTESDDGSRLMINGKAVVGNGGLHGAQEASGDLLLKPGDHDIKIEYFDGIADALMKASWAAPHLEREIIPATVFFHKEDGKEGLQAGLWGEYFDFSNGFPQPAADRKSNVKRVDKNINFELAEGDFGDTALNENFFARWTGILKVPQDGKYIFYTESDDGSRLLIDGKQIVNNGGLHAMQEALGEVELKVGNHQIVIEYFESGGESGLKASWSGPNLVKSIIAENYLFHKKEAE